jgi:putative phosphoribosyl transferase
MRMIDDKRKREMEDRDGDCEGDHIGLEREVRGREVRMRTEAVNSANHELSVVPGEDLGFADGHDAGRRLAAGLEGFREQHPVVVAIPRGGVPVAAKIARELDAPLDLIMMRKIGAPRQPEYAIGALAEGGVRVLAQRELEILGIAAAEVEALIARTEQELSERSERYRGNRRPIDVMDRTVILVDEGLATGPKAMAAVSAVRERGAAHVVLAIPVAAAESMRELTASVDEVVARRPPRTCLRSASGTATSARQPTTKSQPY